MPDPRITKLAQVLVHYSVEVQKGQQVLIRTSPIAEELTLAVYEEVIKAGGHSLIMNEVPGTDEIFYKYASDEQLDFVSPIIKDISEPLRLISISGLTIIRANSVGLIRNEYLAARRHSHP